MTPVIQTPVIYICTTCKRQGTPDSEAEGEPPAGARCSPPQPERAASGTGSHGAAACAASPTCHAWAERRHALQRLMDLPVRRPRCGQRGSFGRPVRGSLPTAATAFCRGGAGRTFSSAA